jgi:hypothetical protein
MSASLSSKVIPVRARKIFGLPVAGVTTTRITNEKGVLEIYVPWEVDVKVF